MTLKSKFHLIILNSILILSFFLTTNCGIYKPVDARKIDPNVNERVKKNIEEGRGFRVMGGKKNQGGTFEFASSNAMWEKNKCIIKKIDSTLAGEIKLAILKEAAILSQQDIETNKVPYEMPGVFKREEWFFQP